MLHQKYWLKAGILLSFFSTAFCCAVLGIQLLVQDKTTKAGIATFIVRDPPAFNPFTSLMNSLFMRGLFQPLETEAQSAASLLATAVPGAASKIQSSAGAIETAIEALLPRNCSLGTTQFCIAFINGTKCNDLPLNISHIVPETVASFVDNEIQSLRPLEGILAKITPASIKGCLILGLVLLFGLIVTFVYLILKIASFLERLGLCLLCLFFCISFIIPTAFMYDVQSKIQSIGPIAGIEKGGASNQVLEALICAIIMAFLAIIMPVFF
ncbi:hypothetical protein BDZ45DRAFT_594494 [Acephala macrosclerotiorum]|nr:hypothetical protein BDZ45DRAFT_594494 [Acephala macrosclerotiorum]